MEKDFFFNDPATTEIYTLSLHDALPFCAADDRPALDDQGLHPGARQVRRRHEAVVSGPQHDDVERFAHHPRPRMNLTVQSSDPAVRPRPIPKSRSSAGPE